MKSIQQPTFQNGKNISFFIIAEGPSMGDLMPFMGANQQKALKFHRIYLCIHP